MGEAIFITGTGTDVGKTYVAGLIVKFLYENGINVGYFKAAMSGNERDTLGRLIPGDALFVKNISGIEQSLEEMCPYIYETAVSPHLASRIEGNPVQMSVIKNQFEKLKEKYDYIVVEGSGGILCPINYDSEEIWLEDIIKELKLSTILVADAGLGTINSVGLTCEYLKNKAIAVKGIIFNHYHAGNVMEDDNIFMCERLTGLKTLAKVSDADTHIEIKLENLK